MYAYRTLATDDLITIRVGELLILFQTSRSYLLLG